MPEICDLGRGSSGELGDVDLRGGQVHFVAQRRGEIDADLPGNVAAVDRRLEADHHHLGLSLRISKRAWTFLNG